MLQPWAKTVKVIMKIMKVEPMTALWIFHFSFFIFFDFFQFPTYCTRQSTMKPALLLHSAFGTQQQIQWFWIFNHIVQTQNSGTEVTRKSKLIKCNMDQCYLSLFSQNENSFSKQKSNALWWMTTIPYVLVTTQKFFVHKKMLTIVSTNNRIG